MLVVFTRNLFFKVISRTFYEKAREKCWCFHDDISKYCQRVVIFCVNQQENSHLIDWRLETKFQQNVNTLATNARVNGTTTIQTSITSRCFFISKPISIHGCVVTNYYKKTVFYNICVYNFSFLQHVVSMTHTACTMIYYFGWESRRKLKNLAKKLEFGVDSSIITINNIICCDCKNLFSFCACANNNFCSGPVSGVRRGGTCRTFLASLYWFTQPLLVVFYSVPHPFQNATDHFLLPIF